MENNNIRVWALESSWVLNGIEETSLRVFTSKKEAIFAMHREIVDEEQDGIITELSMMETESDATECTYEIWESQNYMINRFSIQVKETTLQISPDFVKAITRKEETEAK